MLFCSTELARRIERAECALIEHGTAGVARRVGPDGAFTRPIAGGVAAFSGADSPFTKVTGLGFADLAEAELARIETEFDARGADLQVELCAFAAAGIGALLTRRG